MMESPKRLYTKAGVPSTLHEVCISLLEAGFLARQSEYLRKKLQIVLDLKWKTSKGKMLIPVQQSTRMLCIADELGVLGEDEVSIRFAKPFIDRTSGRNIYFLQGNVLIARVAND